MGLDMYLHQRTHDESDDIELAYWRKFNALHGLIVDLTDTINDNCTEIDLSIEVLEDILNQLITVRDILADGYLHETDNGDVYDEDTTARVCEYLPPRPGCFFGSYEIDEWYAERVRDSIPVFEEALELAKSGAEIYYYAWY